MKLTVNLVGQDWYRGARGFLKYIIEDRGWRRIWIAFGNRFVCVGIIESYSLEDNDNNRTPA